MFIISRIPKRMRMVLLVAVLIFILLVLIDITGFGREALLVSVPLAEDTDLARAEFLAGYGWQVTTVPEEIQEITIPGEFNAVYRQYNDLQQSQGFDLMPFRGKTVKRYTYVINNYPQQVEGVRANLLVYKGEVIGGDVCTVALDGFMHGFSPDDAGLSNQTFYEMVNV